MRVLCNTISRVRLVVTHTPEKAQPYRYFRFFTSDLECPLHEYEEKRNVLPK